MKLPSLTSPSMTSRLNASGKPMFCCVKLTCEVCHKSIKHSDARTMVDFPEDVRKLTHLNGRCEKS